VCCHSLRATATASMPAEAHHAALYDAKGAL
jgi:hypothetical protein